jgi:hypothetical protein
MLPRLRLVPRSKLCDRPLNSNLVRPTSWPPRDRHLETPVYRLHHEASRSAETTSERTMTPVELAADLRRSGRKAEPDPTRPFKIAGANVGYWIAKRPGNGRDQLGS